VVTLRGILEPGQPLRQRAAHRVPGGSRARGEGGRRPGGPAHRQHGRRDNGAAARYDMVRVGGGSTACPRFPAGAGLAATGDDAARPASAVKRVPAGTGVSYNHRYVTPRRLPSACCRSVRRRGPTKRAGMRSSSSRADDGADRRHGVHGPVVIDFGDEPVLAGEEVVLWGREIMVRPPLRNGENARHDLLRSSLRTRNPRSPNERRCPVNQGRGHRRDSAPE